MTDALEYACFAVLNDAGAVVECDRDTWEQWRLDHPNGKIILTDTAYSWTITTSFLGVSTAPDGPPMFWEVRITNPAVAPMAHAFPSRETAIQAHAIMKFRIAGEMRKALAAAGWGK